VGGGGGEKKKHRPQRQGRKGSNALREFIKEYRATSLKKKKKRKDWQEGKELLAVITIASTEKKGRK